MVKTTLQCDLCDKMFTGEYDPEWQTPDDAAWHASCPTCGAVTCPKCRLNHSHSNNDEELEFDVAEDKTKKKD